MTFNIAAVALNPDGWDKGSIEAIIKSQGLAFGQTANLIVFPECSLTGFFPERAVALTTRAKWAELESLFKSLASSLGATILVGAFRAESDGVQNKAIFYSSDGHEGPSYGKVNLFPLARESDFIHAGDAAVNHMIDGFSISPKICYDLRFPSCFYSQSPSIDLFAVIANWPEARRAHWQALLQARAIENEAYVMGVNRLGEDGLGNAYSGEPLLFDPLGGLCEPLWRSDMVSFWSLKERSKYATIGSTRGQLAS